MIPADDTLPPRTRATTREQRASWRWRPAARCVARLEADGRAWTALVRDLSHGGALLTLEPEAGAPPAAGSEVALHVTLGPRALRRRSRVVRHGVDETGRTTLAVAHVGRADEVVDGVAALDLASIRVDPAWALRVPADVALRRRALPLCALDGSVVVAFADVGDEAALAAVQRHVDAPILAQQVDAASLTQAIRRIHGEVRPATRVEDDDAVAVCNELLRAAWMRQASDVHLCPERDDTLVRLRVDGQLEDYRRFPRAAHAEIVSRCKVLAGMDIAERRAPQDGRFTHDLPDGGRVEIRAATLPTNHGERVTLRLLAIEQEALTLEHLGMAGDDLRRVERELARSHGLILATGPTGCGKTTTLNAALRRIIGCREVNAIAVQEPVEYDIPGVTQVEVDSSQKITFASALRSIVRHDPDVIMIGEIRDRETADIGIKAALTGHLVLATLHTNTAASAVTRLIDMGVERFLLAATLRAVIAQRLVRRLCPHCRRPGADGELLREGLLGPDAPPLYVPGACVYCTGRGFTGRSGLFEVLPVDEELSQALLDGADEAGLAASARRRGARSLRDDAVSKLRDGTSSLREVLGALEAESALLRDATSAEVDA